MNSDKLLEAEDALRGEIAKQVFGLLNHCEPVRLTVLHSLLLVAAISRLAPGKAREVSTFVRTSLARMKTTDVLCVAQIQMIEPTLATLAEHEP